MFVAYFSFKYAHFVPNSCQVESISYGYIFTGIQMIKIYPVVFDKLCLWCQLNFLNNRYYKFYDSMVVVGDYSSFWEYSGACIVIDFLMVFVGC